MPKVPLDPRVKVTTFERLKQAMTAQAAHPIWWEIPDVHPKGLDYTQACRTCHFVRGPTGRRACEARFLKALAEAEPTGRPHQFICPIQRYAVVLPVGIQGIRERPGGRGASNGVPGAVGYLAMCHSEKAITRTALELAGLTIESALLEQKRMRQLKNLSETIQPRCVALSTIHTIHRLISSTLNLEELIPRVARLCCQVLRTQVCGIWLVDESKKRYVPRAVVDVTKPKVSNLNPFQVGVGEAGRVASTWKPVIQERRMVVPLVEEECIGVIFVRRSKLAEPFGALDQEILTTLAEQAVIAIRNAQMYEAQERITWGTIKSLSAMLEGMDSAAAGFGRSNPKLMADVALCIAQKMKLSSGLQKSIQYAALLHDAGRVGIPEEILHKPSKLEPAEYAKVKEHLVKGASLLEPINLLEPAIPIILHHHERYDGTGYPKGLKKEGIPLGARILGVANAFEAMVCERPYRKAFSMDQAAQEIASHAGTQFDPKVVEAFVELVRAKRLDAILASVSMRRGGPSR